MVSEVFASEETVALAKQKACEMLSATESDVEFEVIQEPSKRVLGMFGGKLAQVKATLKESVASKACKILKEILCYMNLGSLEVSIISESDELCELHVTGDEVGYIVGKHGETLDSLQYIITLVANDKPKSQPFCKIRIEAGDYREQRRITLENLGKKIAARVLYLGKKCSLEPMRSYERKVVHTSIGEVEGVHSWSEGEGEERHVVVSPQLERPTFDRF